LKRRRKPEQFTIDEAQTATLINTEGTFACWRHTVKGRKYAYAGIRISMCDKEALLPAEKVFKTKIIHAKTKRIECPPELFPPNGKGYYLAQVSGKPAHQIMERLKALITKDKYKKWQQTLKTCLP